jgi:hypothetical protein
MTEAPQTWDSYLNELWDRGKDKDHRRAAYAVAVRDWKDSGDSLSDPCRAPELASCGCLPHALTISPCPGHPEATR